MAVSVNVIASEENTGFVAVGDLGVPANRFTSRRVTKVLGVNMGLVAPTEDVVASMAGENHCLIEPFLEHRVLSSITGCMDRETVDGTRIPCRITDRDLSVFAGSDCEGITWGDRSGHDGGGSKEEEGRDASSHCEVGLRDSSQVWDRT